MKASELIAKLAAVIAENGDAEVTLPDTGCGCCRSNDNEPAEYVEFIAEGVDAWRPLRGAIPAQIYIS